MEWSDALELCRAAAADGTKRIVGTPHVLRDPWWNEEPGARKALFDELNARLGGAPEVLPGAEVWFTADLVALAEAGEAGPLEGLAGSRYLLVEFPPGYVSPEAAAVFHELSVMGIVPVVAHPERNLVFSRDPGLLGTLVDSGAIAQVTAGSILGEFGRGARAAAEAMIGSGLAHLVASDAHDLKRRPPRMAAARAKVRAQFGAGAEEGLFDANPAAIVEDRDLPWPGAL